MKTCLRLSYRRKSGAKRWFCSPVFDAPESLFEDNDKFEEFVIEYVSCDMESSGAGPERDYDEIDFLMFDEFNERKRKTLFKRFEKAMDYALPDWALWKENNVP